MAAPHRKLLGDPAQLSRARRAQAGLSGDRPEGYVNGALLVAGGGFMWSLGGLLSRMIEDARIRRIVAWRTFFMFVTMGCYLAVRYRRRVVGQFTGMGLGGLAAAISIATANICCMFSLSRTWVAYTNLILGASPILAALIAFVLLRERVRRATLFAMVLVAAATRCHRSDVGAAACAGRCREMRPCLPVS